MEFGITVYESNRGKNSLRVEYNSSIVILAIHSIPSLLANLTIKNRPQGDTESLFLLFLRINLTKKIRGKLEK